MLAPANVESTFAGPLHPGLLDACFGLLLSSEDLDRVETQVPFRVACLRVLGRPKGTALVAHAVPDTGECEASDGVIGSVRLFDEGGRPIVEIERLQARQVAASAFVRSDGAVDQELLYQLRWKASLAPVSETAGLAPGSVVVVGRDSQTTTELVRRLHADGRRCYRVVSGGEAWGEDCLSVAPGDPAALRALLDRVEQPVAAVVYVEGLALGALPDEPTPSSTAAQHERGCGGLLDLVQALHRSQWERVAPLWIVTCGAQAAPPGPVHWGQAPLWGLGRVLSVEQPERPCMRLDLDPLRCSHRRR
jgi:hypothetical protein